MCRQKIRKVSWFIWFKWVNQGHKNKYIGSGKMHVSTEKKVSWEPITSDTFFPSKKRQASNMIITNWKSESMYLGSAIVIEVLDVVRDLRFLAEVMMLQLNIEFWWREKKSTFWIKDWNTRPQINTKQANGDEPNIQMSGSTHHTIKSRNKRWWTKCLEKSEKQPGYWEMHA